MVSSHGGSTNGKPGQKPQVRAQFRLEYGSKSEHESLGYEAQVGLRSAQPEGVVRAVVVLRVMCTSGKTTVITGKYCMNSQHKHCLNYYTLYFKLTDEEGLVSLGLGVSTQIYVLHMLEVNIAETVHSD